MSFQTLKEECENAQFQFEEFNVSDVSEVIAKVERYEKALKEILKHSKVSYQGHIAKETLEY